MTEFWQKWNPAVPKSWLYGTAGLMWSGVGFFLNKLAYGWLDAQKWQRAWPFAAVGLALAGAVYYFGFAHLANKNIRRILIINKRTICLFAFQRWQSYFLIVFMIALGIFLRHSPLPKPYLAIVYIGIGGALFLASFHYYKQIAKDKMNGRLPQQK
jgi:hypothetical protein